MTVIPTYRSLYLLILNFLLIGPLVLTTSEVQGQGLNVKQLGEMDGVPSREVYEVTQDSEGYIWISTESGVVRYDGYSCKFVSLGEGIDHSDVFGIWEDKRKRIWFRTISGEVCFLQNGKIHNSQNDSLCKKLRCGSSILRITEWEDRIYFISYLDGVKILDGATITIRKTGTLRGGCAGPKGILLVGNEEALLLDRQANLCQVDGIWRNRFFSTCSNFKGRYFVSYRHLLMAYDSSFTSLDTVFKAASEEAEIIHQQVLNDSILVISTRDGAYFFNVEQREVVRMEMKGSSVSSIFQDQNGGFWYSTLGEGVFYDAYGANPPALLFPHELNRPISSLAKGTDGSIWVGTDSNMVFKWHHDRLRAYKMRTSEDNYLGRITRIKEEADGLTYVLGKRLFARIAPGEEPVVGVMNGNDFVLDGDSGMWVGAAQCYYITFFNNWTGFQEHAVIRLARRTNALAYSGDSLLVGTDLGLFSFHGSDTTYSPVQGMEEYPIAAINLPYILTQGGKVFVLDSMGVNPYLPNTSMGARCYTILPLKDRLYVGTSEGLYRYESGTRLFEGALGKIKIFALERKGDSLLVGSDRGLLAFPIDEYQQKEAIPLLYLDSVLVNGSRRELTELTRLSHRENAILIRYTGLLYSHRPTYRYRINQEEWLPSDTRELNLKLAPGNYTITLQALNEGEFISESLQIPIRISLPFWREPLFVIFVIVLVILMLGGSAYAYLKKIQTDYARQRELDQAHLQFEKSKNRLLELEQQALRLQMNPHFLFNSINSIKGLYAQGKVREAITYIHHFSNFLRVIVNNEDPLISVKKEIEILRNYLSLEKMKFPLMEFEIDLSEEIEPERMFIPFMLIQPYAENAILHGLGPKQSKGKISIRFSRENETELRIEVEDDGVGLNGKKITPNKSSLGMRITEERLGLFNETVQPDIKVTDKEVGTGVIVSFKTRFVYE